MDYLKKYLNKSQATKLRNKILTEAIHINDCDLKEELIDIADDLRNQEGYLSNLVRSEFNYSFDAMQILNDCASELPY